ncbi:hypothetical protein BAY1663_05031 [Pseudomonas sp. BAY1663]|uniref:hypothetical protein n=1 Tax=Pseudomonas sp. BAY1663 TaxID=1439940 RepID=UPI00042DFA62|nr:hypothetical protein [Pseudomonas sp. BAY1663]EXF42568.1 hypothetical protein BAY1663_05031 [Pseudomonas sp. BAY1663]
MKSIFFAIWALLSLLLGGVAILAALAEPGLSSGFFVLLTAYYAFCFFQLIRAFYQPWGLLGPRRRTGYWLCLLLLPLALLPLHAAYEIWQQGAYVVEDTGRMRFSIAVVRQGLVWLQELVGHLGPMLVMLALGVTIAVGLLRLLRTQVVR